MALFDSIRLGSSGVQDDFEVERSLRFNRGDNAHLSRTFSSAGNRKTFTFSAWFKITFSGVHGAFFSGSKSGTGFFKFMFRDDGRLEINTSENSQSDSTVIRTTRKFRDPTAWFHLVVAYDTTQATASNRVKIYINGIQETVFDNNTFPPQNHDVTVNVDGEHQVGNQVGTSNYYDGYMTEVHFINGLQLTPSSFAKTNTETNQWIPKDTSGLTYGTNGFRLQFSDNTGTSATTLGKDTSGNSNNFTPNNFNVTANDVDNDSVLDTPTNNWCTLNPLTGYWAEGGEIPPADGMLHANNPNSGDRSNFATFRLKAGKKYYFEGKYFEQGSGSQCKWAITSLDRLDGRAVKPFGAGAFGVDWRGGAGTPTSIDPAGASNIGSRPSNGQVIGVAIDLVNGKFYAHKGNSYYNSGDPDNGTGAIVTNIPTGVDYNFIGSVDSGGPVFASFKINFGQQGFAHQPSSFTDLLNSQNLDDPAIALPKKYFDIFLYDATGNAMSFSGLDFQPDWIWQKSRNSTVSSNVNYLIDANRGGNLGLVGNSGNAEYSGAAITFTSNGYDMGASSGGQGNASGNSYVSWNWFAGGSTVTNNNGSISSQVRASTTSGVSIVTYTGNGQDAATVGHGLGVAPQIVLVKRRNASDDWRMNVGPVLESGKEGHSLKWNSAGGENDANNLFNSTNPSSTVFTLGSSPDADVNSNGSTYVAYCFAAVEGFSSFGRYMGNGATNGRVIFTGFKPAWVMIKTTQQAGDWVIIDSTRSATNPRNKRLDANASDAEQTEIIHDFLANGFKLRSSSASKNPNSEIQVYWAFAEAPFKYARAS